VAKEKKEAWLSYLAPATVMFAVCATLSTFRGGRDDGSAAEGRKHATDAETSSA